jgi:hypothetical protein
MFEPLFPRTYPLQRDKGKANYCNSLDEIIDGFQNLTLYL